jgi:CotS family spore coat protein
MREIKTGLVDYLSLKYEMDIQEVRPVKNVVRIVTSEGDKCLKRVKYKKGHFLFILSAMRHLLDRGFYGIIPFIPTCSGEWYVELEDGYGFLTDWISSRECDYSNPIDLKMAAVTLAKLHNASRGFTIEEGTEPRIGWGKWIEKFSERLRDMDLFKKIIESKSYLTGFDEIYLDNVDNYIEQGISAIEHLKDSKYFELSDREMKEKSFCHHDYAHHNVLISNDFNVYIIDFDYCICDTRLHDLSSLVIRNMRHGNWNMEKAQYIIDCYLKAGHLEKDEIPVMNGFMEFPQDFWQVGLQYYVEKQRWDEVQFNKRLDNFIKDKRERMQFLDEYKYSIEL